MQEVVQMCGHMMFVSTSTHSKLYGMRYVLLLNDTLGDEQRGEERLSGWLRYAHLRMEIVYFM
jgi:hypothetical protein